MAEPLLQVVGAVRRPEEQRPAGRDGGNQWETIFDRASGAGGAPATTRSDLPFSAVWGPRGATWTNPITRFYADCAAGTLPNIAFVDPPFRDGGGGDGLSADEHPLGDVRLGQASVADVVNAFVSSPAYRRGALFVIYDEWGGFFDHVAPPHVPDDRPAPTSTRTSARWASGSRRSRCRRSRAGAQPHGLPRGPRAVRPRVDPKLISYRFGLGDLSCASPRLATSASASIGSIRTSTLRRCPTRPRCHRACALGGGDVLDSQARARERPGGARGAGERFGVPSYEGKLGDIFTLPDTMRRAVLSR